VDPLSDVLSILRPRSYMFRGLDARAPWSIAYPPTDGFGCYAVVSGACWLVVEGEPEAIRLATGDCVLLTRDKPFRMASDLALSPVDAVALFGAVREGSVVTLNGGGADSGVGGYFDFGGKDAGLLRDLLPPIVHIRDESDKAALRSAMELMMRELREPQPGGFLVARHLAQLMLVLAIRLHLTRVGGVGAGWLSALMDRQLAAAISAMHENPAQAWTLQMLARTASMSRSSFAQRFKEKVGLSPMEYLTRWRMLLAGEKLRSSGESIAAIGYSLGYESESAFGAAFRRLMGCSPRQYARGRRR